MSERQEKKRRYNQKLEWIAALEKWMEKEPPIWKLFAWRRWKDSRPERRVYDEIAVREVRKEIQS